MIGRSDRDDNSIRNMRKFYIVFAALVLGVGCKRVEVPPTTEPMSVEITPAVAEQQQFAAPTRAEKFTYFAENSKVGIYMVNYVGTVASTLKSTGNHADNECFTAGADGVLRKVPALFYPLPEVATLVDIYAYYPFTDSMKKDVSVCGFVVDTDQSTAAKQLASDLCWAKNLRSDQDAGIAPSASPVAMEFVHKFSKVRVELNISAISPSGKEVDSVSNVRINGAYLATTMNLATGVVTLKNAASDVRSSIAPLAVQAGVPGGDKYVYEVIIPAQTLLVGYNFVTFDLNYKDGSSSSLSYKISSGTFGTSGSATLAGKLHKISLTLGEGMEILLTGSQITDWTTGVTVGGVVDNEVTTTFNVTMATPAANVTRVVVKTDYEGNFDIKTGVTYAAGVCNFKFEKNKGPRDYGFRITSLQFFDGTTAVSGEIIKTSTRVYSTGVMDLGTW